MSMFSLHRSCSAKLSLRERHRRLIVEPLERREMLSVSLAGDGLTVPVCESGNVAEAPSLSLAHDCAAPIEVITIPLAQFWISQNVTDPTQVHLAWPEAEGADGYYIYTYQNGTSIFLASVGPDETQFTVGDLAPGQTHHFLIQALSDDGLVSSPWQSVTTLPALVAPSWINLEATGPTQVQLEWSDVEGENGYDIYAFSHPTNGPIVPGTSGFNVAPAFTWSFLAAVGADETQCAVSDLAPGNTHYFYIEARYDNGVARSALRSVTTPALVSPNWINLEAAGPTQVQLEWSDVEGEDGYDIYAYSHAT